MFGAAGPDHVVLFPASDEELAEHVYEHLFGNGAPGTVILVASAEHRRLIADRMARGGIDVAAEWARGSFVALDAAETLASFMVAGWPDAAAFWRTLSPVLKRARARPGEVRVFGEMVAQLWDAGQTGAAVDLEALWNELARQYTFSLLCAYPADADNPAEHIDDISHVQAAHSAVLRGPKRI
ncbi:MAG TPA: MEDS domain-containing protein [Streptosporangiaceae bacterium]|nr:MEDS domain-containing protein [Streptosporangiaceae bacterium]